MAYADGMYDMTRLNDLGRRRKKIVEQEEALRPELEVEIRKAHVAGVKQKTIIDVTGYSREMVRLASMTDEEREAERAKRRKSAQEELEVKKP